METIIYFYHCKDETNFITEKWKEEDYCLIRAGVPPFVWRGKEEGIQTRVREWQQALLFLSENPDRCSCVYEDFLIPRLSAKVWSPMPVPAFQDYREEKWMVKLLPALRWNRNVILGFADYLPGYLLQRARKMQSLQWVVRAEQYTDAFQNFIEEFLDETGLAVQVHVVDAGKPMTGLFLQSGEPVNVWDFSGEEKVFATALAGESVWLDMDACEGKEERLTNRNPGILYVSLKKLWNQRQKEPYCLDTPYKNGYNT